MEWWVSLTLILVIMMVLMLSGMLTAYCFFIIVFAGAFSLWGGEAGFNMIILSLKSSITKFELVPIVLFVLMGSIMTQSKMAFRMVNAVNKLLGRLPGRLALVAIVAGTIFAAISGSAVASTAMLGTALTPQMEQVGYKKQMSLGPIMGAGCLDVLIPPSGLAIFIAVIAQVSSGRFLVAIIVPGLIMAGLFFLYIVIRCWIDPSLAPDYEMEKTPWKDKLLTIGKDIMPLSIIVLLVTGIIVFGIATPSEAAATGCLATLIMVIIYREFDFKNITVILKQTVRVSGMILLVIASATAFSQILTFTQASTGMVNYVLSLHLQPLVLVAVIQIIVIILGMPMPVAPLIMIILPLTMPIITAVGLDQIWYVTLILINAELSNLTPPFGTVLFVMHGVAPKGTKMGDVFRASVPFCCLQLVIMLLIFAFPILVNWLPKLAGF